jgi:hypothetical protein
MMMSVMLALLQAAQPAEASAVELPRWLAGCWMAEGEGRQTEECWTVPRGNMILGSSHEFTEVMDVQPDHSTIDTSRTLGFEHMRIIAHNGVLTYVAQPGGAPPIRFSATTMTSIHGEETLVFVNEAHDYPQRITYRYTHARNWEMTAEVSMADGSRPRRWLFRRPRP